MLWNTLALEGAVTDGIALNSLFSLSVMGLGLATLYWKVEPSRNAAWERWCEGFLRLLPLAAVVLAGLAVILSDPHTGVSPAVSHAVKAGALVVVMLAMLKQSTLVHEHDLLKIVSRHLHQSEQQKHLILQALPDLIWLKDANGVFQMCNPGFERLLGAPESVIVGKTDFDFVDPELARFFQQKDREAMAAGHPTQNEEWVVFASDGHRALLDTVKTPLLDPDGHVIGVLGIARDITERESSNRHLALVNFALNHVKEAAYMADEQGHFHYVNDEACRSLGHTRDELLALRVIDVDGNTTQPQQWQAFWDQLKTTK
ncbi:MAG: PAS domain-containing protein, partial [Gammaproteobacteria bacterium]|nr:PAS domain-containing protein [Gammaproteobacteria bacterium]